MATMTAGPTSTASQQRLDLRMVQKFAHELGKYRAGLQPITNFLYRWFVGLSPDAPIWDPTTFTKNRKNARPTAQKRLACEH